MQKKPTGKPGGCQRGAGAPKKPIDWELFEKLCAVQCTQEEMADMFKVNRDTLRDRAVEYYEEDYSAIYKKLSVSGKCSIRRHQFAHLAKNASMAMYLGKVYLGQRDTPDNNTPPNDDFNEREREYIKQNGQLLAEIKRLKAGNNVAQTATEYPRSE